MISRPARASGECKRHQEGLDWIRLKSIPGFSQEVAKLMGEVGGRTGETSHQHCKNRKDEGEEEMLALLADLG